MTNTGQEKSKQAKLEEFYGEISQRHDFALELQLLTEEQVKTVCQDLKVEGWRCHVEKGHDEKSKDDFVVLLALDRESKIIAEAER